MKTKVHFLSAVLAAVLFGGAIPLCGQITPVTAVNAAAGDLILGFAQPQSGATGANQNIEVDLGSYHIAGLLALHEHFIGLKDNPVPRFLVVDQPSQVYFPEAWPSMDEAPDAPGKTDRSPDIDGVHRLFGALAAFFESVGAHFQIIVTEHAGAITWAGVSHVHLVGNWREEHDEFLIPIAWRKPEASA